MVDIFKFEYADGSSFGCGTKVEFDYWQSQGIYGSDARLGAVIGKEPKSEDERRKAAWAA